MSHDAAGEGNFLRWVYQQRPRLGGAGGYVGYTAAAVAARAIPDPSVVHGVALDERLAVIVVIVIVLLVLFACHGLVAQER